MCSSDLRCVAYDKPTEKKHPTIEMKMSIPKLEFPPFHLPPEAEALRGEVRSFLHETLPKVKSEDRFASWNTFSPEFSRALGKRGWIGLTWPKEYGGGERSFLERLVVTEELLGNSAPAGAHWVADRQSGPVLLRFGSEEQRKAILDRKSTRLNSSH